MKAITERARRADALAERLIAGAFLLAVGVWLLLR